MIKSNGSKSKQSGKCFRFFVVSSSPKLVASVSLMNNISGMERKKVDIQKVAANEGQIEGLPRNPRLIRDDKFKKLLKSIRELPEMTEARDLLVVPHGDGYVVIGGNMRLAAYRELGWKEVPCCILPEGMPTDKLREIVIQDNNPFGETDWDMIANEWDVEEIKGWGVDLPESWNTSEAEDQREAEDDGFNGCDEIETDIEYGDIYEISFEGLTHRLACGDSCKHDDVARLMCEEKADLIFTDPPYDLEDNYSENIFDFAKENCHIFIMNSDRKLVDNVVNGIKWFRRFFAVDFRQARLVSNSMPMTRVDLIAEFLKGKSKFVNLHDGFSTLIECSKIHSDKVDMNFGHKQAKRVELPAAFISHYSKIGELVVDLFGGSWTTLVASQQLGRRCYIQEYSPKNCQIIINRFLNSFKDAVIQKI